MHLLLPWLSSKETRKALSPNPSTFLRNFSLRFNQSLASQAVNHPHPTVLQCNSQKQQPCIVRASSPQPAARK